MPASTALANAALNLIFGATAWSSRPATLHFALFTSNPTAGGGGTEVSGSNYSRKAVTANTANFSDPVTAGDNVTLNTAVTWPRASGSWGTITGWGIYTNASGSLDLLYYEAFDTPFTVGNSQTPSLAAGSVTFSFGGQFGNLIEQKFLRHFLRGVAWTGIGTHYFALGTGATEAGLTGEPTIGTNGYVRKSMVNNTTTWATASGGLKNNGAAIAFASASGAWGGAALSHFGIYDAATGGNLLWWGTLANSVSISSGVYQWNIAELTVGFGS